MGAEKQNFVSDRKKNDEKSLRTDIHIHIVTEKAKTIHPL